MKLSIVILSILLTATAWADCRVRGGAGQRDVLFAVVSTAATCPLSVQELRRLLAEDGLAPVPALVANRGAHNPARGSFSIFESTRGASRLLGQRIAPEHLYFGHFTDLNAKKEVVLDQQSQPNKLLIEVIAYDFQKGLYNFYELVGTPAGPEWFFRGNTLNALEDNRLLKLGKRPQFGTHMRCSACHNSGGPIMKELSPPHNDWWTKARGLDFGANKPSAELQRYLSSFVDASEFSRNVFAGMKLLERRGLAANLSLKEKLRPLFCTTEINLRSDSRPLAAPASGMEIPAEVFVDPILAKAPALRLSKQAYLQGLGVLGSQFPETTLTDADHGFLAPVKGVANHLQITELIEHRVIDLEFALDVLSVDFKSPMFSQSRCELLSLVRESSDWKESFLVSLKVSSLKAAPELAAKLAVVNGAEHRKAALEYLRNKEASWQNPEAVLAELRVLNHLRASVFRDEISQNPKGQILEPGFRVIFPVFKR